MAPERTDENDRRGGDDQERHGERGESPAALGWRLEPRHDHLDVRPLDGGGDAIDRSEAFNEIRHRLPPRDGAARGGPARGASGRRRASSRASPRSPSRNIPRSNAGSEPVVARAGSAGAPRRARTTPGSRDSARVSQAGVEVHGHGGPSALLRRSGTPPATPSSPGPSQPRRVAGAERTLRPS